MVEYYKQAKRGIVCALIHPIQQKREEDEQAAQLSEESGDYHMTVCSGHVIL